MHAHKENAMDFIEKSLAFQNQRMLGTIVGKDVRYNPTAAGGGQFVSDFRLREARRIIAGLGQQLQVADFYVRQAQNLYVLLQGKGFTPGRSTALVALGCLYLVCRQNQTGHMMRDFVNVVEKVDVYMISKIYLKICQATHQSLALSDPSFYVPRFVRAAALPAELEADVLNYVNQLLFRMRVDWMSHGRRPVGLVAAAFYIACKCFALERSVREIAGVFGVSSETVRKRVNEFKALRVAQLTREEFAAQLASLEGEDPPAFRRNRLLELDLEVTPPLALPATVCPPDEPIRAEEFDESEIEQQLLLPGESRVKEALWQKSNEEWLQEQKLRAEVRARKEEDPRAQRSKHREAQRVHAAANDDAVSFKSLNRVVDSIMSSSKLAKQLDPAGLERLFEHIGGAPGRESLK